MAVAASVAIIEAKDDDGRHVVNPCIPKLCILRKDRISNKRDLAVTYLVIDYTLTNMGTFCYFK